jgi:uncharacterized protein YjbI with pentapeptide repeats
MAKNAFKLPKKLAGKKVAFAGKFGSDEAVLRWLQDWAKEEGARIVDGEKQAPDYLIVGAGPGGKQPPAAARIREKHPHVQVLDDADFHRLRAPTADDLMTILQSGPYPFEAWEDFRSRLSWAKAKIDLCGRDLRNLDLSNAYLAETILDGADLRGAKLAGAILGELTNVRLDGADLRKCDYFNRATGCSLKKAKLSEVSFNPGEFADCDFSGAELKELSAHYARAAGCTFAGADLAHSTFNESDLKGCDFSGARLTAARLEKCDLRSANLSRADLSDADLRGAKLAGADLRKARFANAVLSGADLTGAKIDGADFTGANLAGAVVAGLDPHKAKNLVVKAVRTAGPNMRKLAQVAAASRRLTTTIRLHLADDGHVDLTPSLRQFSGRPLAETGYMHESPKGGLGHHGQAASFEQAMLELTDLWARGTPDFESVQVDAKQCPLKGAELRDLVVAAWHEALGLAVPTEAELRDREQVTAKKTATLRDQMLAELRGGLAGVKKWNARPETERRKIGKLRRLDLTGGKLAGANLETLDFEHTRFDRADLKKASFHDCPLAGASFAGADLAGAYLAGAKAAEATFEGTKLVKCNLRAASFRRCSFRGADLTKADFSFSDVRGADFTDAILDGVEFARTTFDDKTTFPPGFVPPDGLEWKGAGPRPTGAAAPAAAVPTGPLDFDGLLEFVANSVEASRLANARKMLKAERFQLFADVTPDQLIGIVKSQSTKDRVYSCRLVKDGSFACCTQNLKPCGGLQGAVCKHLLVLAIGLAKAGAIDPTTVARWLDASKAHKPELDSEVMSAAFLKFKGAEAGDIDWRPTETIPEDFYAM